MLLRRHEGLATTQDTEDHLHRGLLRHGHGGAARDDGGGAVQEGGRGDDGEDPGLDWARSLKAGTASACRGGWRVEPGSAHVCPLSPHHDEGGGLGQAGAGAGLREGDPVPRGEGRGPRAGECRTSRPGVGRGGWAARQPRPRHRVRLVLAGARQQVCSEQVSPDLAMLNTQSVGIMTRVWQRHPSTHS